MRSDEAGLKGFRMAVWHGLYASADMPKEIRKQGIAQLNHVQVSYKLTCATFRTIVKYFLIIPVTHPAMMTRTGAARSRAVVGETFGQGVQLLAAIEAPGEAGRGASGRACALT